MWLFFGRMSVCRYISTVLFGSYIVFGGGGERKKKVLNHLFRSMGKPDKRVRRFQKKMTRVVNSSQCDAPSTAAPNVASDDGGVAVPLVVIPEPIQSGRVLTKRERLVRKSFASKKSVHDRSTNVVGKKKADSDAHPQKGKRSSVVATTESSEAIQKGTAKQKLSSSLKHASRKAGPGMVHQVSTKTSLNLPQAQRQRMGLREIEHIQNVMSNTEYQQDPFAAIRSHLASTMQRLPAQEPQNQSAHNKKKCKH